MVNLTGRGDILRKLEQFIRSLDKYNSNVQLQTGQFISIQIKGPNL